jgi:hypothetical protein
MAVSPANPEYLKWSEVPITIKEIMYKFDIPNNIMYKFDVPNNIITDNGTHIVMSLLIFCLVRLLVLRLISFRDLTIAYMVLVHERIALCLDTLVTSHVLVVVIVPHVGMVFPLEVHILTLSIVTLTVHAFPIMVHVSLTQIVRCKGL